MQGTLKAQGWGQSCLTFRFEPHTADQFKADIIHHCLWITSNSASSFMKKISTTAWEPNSATTNLLNLFQGTTHREALEPIRHRENYVSLSHKKNDNKYFKERQVASWECVYFILFFLLGLYLQVSSDNNLCLLPVKNIPTGGSHLSASLCSHHLHHFALSWWLALNLAVLEHFSPTQVPYLAKFTLRQEVSPVWWAKTDKFKK